MSVAASGEEFKEEGIVDEGGDSAIVYMVDRPAFHLEVGERSHDSVHDSHLGNT